MTSTQLQSQNAPGCARLSVKALCIFTCLVLFLFAGFAYGQASPVYGNCSGITLGSPSLYGSSSLPNGDYGGALNGFLPYPSDYTLYQNISAAAVDPNSASLIANLNTVSHNTLHILMGSSPADGDIPYYVTDSSIETNRIMPVTTGSPDQSEVMQIPYPNNDAMPIEGDAVDCSIWPDTDNGDDHSLLLDRNGCWLYEIWVTSRCPGSDLNMHYEANSITLFDAQNFAAGPWGFTSADASGMSVYVNTLKYDEAASGVIRHPVRFTVPTSAGSSLFIIPASHGASSSTLANKLPEGALLRLNPSRTPTINTSGMTTEDATVIIPAIIAGLQNYGMIMADNGSNMYLIGDNDPRWNDNDLGELNAIVASDFDVVQMVPEYPSYMSEATAHTTFYPETAPTITSFSASATGITPVSVAGVYVPPVQTPGSFTVPNTSTSVTFEVCVTGNNWNENFSNGTTAKPTVYIDNAGPVRIGSNNCGSTTVTPKITQEYTAYVLNTQSNYQNNGLPNLATINVTVTGASLIPAPVVFIPPPTLINGQPVGNSPGYVYASDTVKVTPVTSTWAPLNTNDNVWNDTNATYFYTTATGTSSTFPTASTTSPLPTETGGSAGSATTKLSTSTTASITVTKSSTGGTYGYEVVCAIATVPSIGTAYGNSNPSTNSCATYVFTGTGSTASVYVNAPIILPPSGTYNTPPLISMAGPVPATSAASYNAIFYTTNGATPTTAGAGFSTYSSPPSDGNTLVFFQGEGNSCYGSNVNYGVVPNCNPYGVVYATNGMTVKALAVNEDTKSVVTTNTYTIIAANPTFSPAPGDYYDSATVTISSLTGSPAIYYTTDGSTPTTNSPEYSSPLSITATTLLKALTACAGCQNSGVTSGIYTIETPAVLTTPPPNSTLTGTSVAFAWTPGNSASHFELWVGTTAGSSNLYNSGSVTATTETVSGLPSNGQPVYVKLQALINGVWESTSYTYTAYGSPTPAALTTPTPGSTLTGTSVAFGWAPGNTAKNFELWVGTTAGSSNLYNSGSVTVTTETVSNLPSNGQPVYVRLLSYVDGVWDGTNYTYTATGSPVAAAITTPVASSTLTGTSVAFAWTPGNTATQFQLWVGTTAGSTNLYNSGTVTVTTETVSDLPTNGQPVYARLYSYIDGAWQYASYTYTA
jgi:uncharacterized protein YbaP (TraB family)